MDFPFFLSSMQIQICGLRWLEEIWRPGMEVMDSVPTKTTPRKGCIDFQIYGPSLENISDLLDLLSSKYTGLLIYFMFIEHLRVSGFSTNPHEAALIFGCEE